VYTVSLQICGSEAIIVLCEHTVNFTYFARSGELKTDWSSSCEQKNQKLKFFMKYLLRVIFEIIISVTYQQ